MDHRTLATAYKYGTEVIDHLLKSLPKSELQNRWDAIDILLDLRHTLDQRTKHHISEARKELAEDEQD